MISDLPLYFACYDTYAVENKSFIQARLLLKLNWKRKCIRWLALGAAVDMVVLIAVTLLGIGMPSHSTLKPSMSNPRAICAPSAPSSAVARMHIISIRVNSTRAVKMRNKVFLLHLIVLSIEMEADIARRMSKVGELWQCLDCLWTTKYKTTLWEHIEAKHVTSAGYTCPICHKFCPSRNAWHLHKSRYHKGV